MGEQLDTENVNIVDTGCHESSPVDSG